MGERFDDGKFRPRDARKHKLRNAIARFDADRGAVAIVAQIDVAASFDQQ